MLFNLLLASINFIVFLLFISCCFKNYFINPNVIENARPQLAPIIPAGALITVAKDAMEILLATTDKKKLICFNHAIYWLIKKVFTIMIITL